MELLRIKHTVKPNGDVIYNITRTMQKPKPVNKIGFIAWKNKIRKELRTSKIKYGSC